MDCLDKLLIVRFTEQRMFWKNTIKIISGSAIEKDINAVQKFVSQKEAFSSITPLYLYYSSLYCDSYLWRAYGGIRALPEGYNHLQVNHSVYFVDLDTQAYTKPRRKYVEECEDIT